MKILLLTTHLEIGGITLYVLNLAKGLAARGHKPVVVSSGGWGEKVLREAGIPHHRISCRTSSELNPKLWWSAFPRLLAALKEERPQLIHAHTRVTQVLAEAAHLITRAPYVTTCHGLYKFRIGRILFRCWGRWVMAISGPSMDRLVNQYRLSPPHKVVLVRNGIPVEHFLEAPSPEAVARFKQNEGLDGDPIVGGIGRLSPVKGFDLLMEAAAILRGEFPRLQLLIAGDGPAREELVRKAYALGIADRVVLAHSVEDTRVPLSLMKVFVSAARREGFGLSIVEAMASGIPVVSTDAGGPAEIIETGASGLLVPPEDPRALARAIGSLLKDPALAGRIGRAGRERAKSQFNIDRMVGEVEAVYARALA